MLGDYNQVEVVAKAGNVVARTDLADNQYSSADPRLVLFNEVAGVGKTPFALHFNAAYNDPQSPWIQLFRAAVFEDADDAAIDAAQRRASPRSCRATSRVAIQADVNDTVRVPTGPAPCHHLLDVTEDHAQP